MIENTLLNAAINIVEALDDKMTVNPMLSMYLEADVLDYVEELRMEIDKAKEELDLFEGLHD